MIITMETYRKIMGPEMRKIAPGTSGVLLLLMRGILKKRRRKKEEKKGEKIRSLGPQLPPHGKSFAEKFDEENEHRERERENSRKEKKALQKQHYELLEDMVPKATGREALLEKKKATADFHRRERSPDMDYNDHDLMGGSSDFQSTLKSIEKSQSKKREFVEQKKAEKASAISEKIHLHQAKEQQTLAMFAEMAKRHKLGGQQ